MNTREEPEEHVVALFFGTEIRKLTLTSFKKVMAELSTFDKGNIEKQKGKLSRISANPAHIAFLEPFDSNSIVWQLRCKYVYLCAVRVLAEVRRA